MKAENCPPYFKGDYRGFYFEQHFTHASQTLTSQRTTAGFLKTENCPPYVKGDYRGLYFEQHFTHAAGFLKIENCPPYFKGDYRGFILSNILRTRHRHSPARGLQLGS